MGRKVGSYLAPIRLAGLPSNLACSITGESLHVAFRCVGFTADTFWKHGGRQNADFKYCLDVDWSLLNLPVFDALRV